MAHQCIRVFWLYGESHAALAQLYTRTANYPQANREFAKAIQIIDNNVDMVSTQNYKLTFFSLLIGFYQNYVRALVAQQGFEQALEVADSSRRESCSSGWPSREYRKSPPPATAPASREVRAASCCSTG